MDIARYKDDLKETQETHPTQSKGEFVLRSYSSTLDGGSKNNMQWFHTAIYEFTRQNPDDVEAAYQIGGVVYTYENMKMTNDESKISAVQAAYLKGGALMWNLKMIQSSDQKLKWCIQS